MKDETENDFFQIFKNIIIKRPPRGPENRCQTSGSLFKFLFKKSESKSQFVKNANFTKIRRRSKLKFQFIFSDVMRGFCPNFKNEAEI